METDFYPRQCKSRMMQIMKQTQSYVTKNVCIINSTSLVGSSMGQKMKCGSQKLRYNMHKRYCNITRRTTCRSEFPVRSAVKTEQELFEVPGQMMFMRHTCMAGMSTEKLQCFSGLCGRTEFHMVELGRKLAYNTPMIFSSYCGYIMY